MKRGSLADGLEPLYVLLLESRRQGYRQANAIGNLQPHGLAEVLQGLLRGIRGIAIEDGFEDNIARSGIFSADRSVADYADIIWHVPYKK